MLSFWTFQPIIESWTSCLTFALFHTRTSPIHYKTMFNLSFIFNGVDVVIFIKETDLSSWIVWIFEYFLHVLNCKKGKIFHQKKLGHIANLFKNKSSKSYRKFIHCKLSFTRIMVFSQKVGAWLCSPAIYLSLSFRVERLAWQLLNLILIHLHWANTPVFPGLLVLQEYT